MEKATLDFDFNFKELQNNYSIFTATELYENKTSDNVTNPYYFYKTEQLTFLWFLFAVIVMGNCAVLLALSLSKNKKSRMNFFIMHLAIADLAVGIISVLTDIIWKMTVSWYAGNSGCKIIRFLQVLVTYSSTYVLVALSIDRFDAIAHPMNFTGSWRRAKMLIVIAWLTSAVFSIPILYLYEERSIKGQLQCWIDFPGSSRHYWQLYMSLVSVALFIIPMLIITVCYTLIICTIWRKGNIIVTKPASNEKTCSNRYADCKRASSRGLIPKAKIKTVKMTFTIVFAFVLCWSPYILFDLLQVYGFIPNSQTNVAISTFIQSLAPLNSAANPIIYCLFSTRICRNFRKLSLINWMVESSCISSFTRESRSSVSTCSAGRSAYSTVSESSRRSTRSIGNGLNRHQTPTIKRSSPSKNIEIKEFKHVIVDSLQNASYSVNSQV